MAGKDRLFERSIGEVKVTESGIISSGTIPDDLPLFQDHFPDFPVLPGVLAVELLKCVSEKHLNSISGSKALHYRIQEVRSVKFASVIKPGSDWEAKLDLLSNDGSGSRWKGKLLSGGRLAAMAEWTMIPA